MSQLITDKIKSKALELNFLKVGVAPAQSLEEEGFNLKKWLKNNYQASMYWLEKDIEKRIDPAKVLPSVKSILCVALNYYEDVKHYQNRDYGKISRYAWGKDYHKILENKLRALYEFIKSIAPKVNGKFYVDTGPVMEKIWAVRSGIGWMGKHTNVISRECGSWIFLGEILLDIELVYDKPMHDYCGNCTACIDACPTKAIVQPYVLDSRKCISYLTIEHRGDLPIELKHKFENWVFGCDICQNVCPWNKFQKVTSEESFKPHIENIAPKLIELANLSKEEFNRRFGESPVKRTKHNGLVRNAKTLLEYCKSSI